MNGFHWNEYVKVHVKGGQASQLFLELHRLSIPMHDIKRENETEIKFCTSLDSVKEIKSIRKRFQCKVYFERKNSIKRAYKMRGRMASYVLGTFFALFLLFALSNVIWKVEIVGGSPESRFEVSQLIDQLGLKQGNWVQASEDISTVEREVMNQIEKISYIGINRTGTTFLIKIKEQSINEPDPDEHPSNLIASKSGTIHSMFITNGRPLAKVNDTVKKGDILVTGELSEEGEDFTYSEGDILAEVWYNIDVTIENKALLYSLEDEATQRYSLNIGNREFFATNKEDLVEVHKRSQPLFFLNWELPLSINKTLFLQEQSLEQTIETEDYTNYVEAQLKRKLGQSVELIYLKVLHEQRHSDKVELELFVKVIEDISEAQIINQGD
ncbi:hypothetical protein CEY16_04565 [Halalkalibacillus sediminis]|uniref:Sporulation protein YqfD n=1 Tax=Halalkalibacillus sediminis TaxID=2018042 RepID=A0A2I0QXJ2_9BACI|nr:sporulation protein YqfD [Halalkalibacillus sediminis]PKR79028.1 hypothetical protein CEY16_04565 [Halalkalibacillus sediminis]